MFTNSANTRDELLERFDLPSGKAVVRPLGATVPAEPRTAAISGGPLVLNVGERGKPYKNWGMALNAADGLGPDVRLACFGPSPDGDDHDQVAARHHNDRVRFVGGDDRDLAPFTRPRRYSCTHRGSKASGSRRLRRWRTVARWWRHGLEPSPRWSAMRRSFFDPADVDALVDAVSLALADGAGVAAMKAAGRARVKTFTWDRTVEATLAGYRSVAR